jgi:hypothetical protein
MLRLEVYDMTQIDCQPGVVASARRIAAQEYFNVFYEWCREAASEKPTIAEDKPRDQPPSTPTCPRRQQRHRG